MPFFFFLIMAFTAVMAAILALLSTFYSSQNLSSNPDHISNAYATAVAAAVLCGLFIIFIIMHWFKKEKKKRNWDNQTV